MASGSLTSASGALIVVNSHAAYIEKAGRASESGVGNALVGSYLTQIGLSENAVVYITQAAPTEMTWLNLREAKQIGIEVLPFEEQTPATKPAPPVTSREASNQEISSRARLFVKESIHDCHASMPLSGLVSCTQTKSFPTANCVLVVRLLLNTVFNTEQWPERSYSIQDKSMNAVCGESGPGPAQPVPQVPVECIVTGTMEWKGREAR
jgi:hypothetical protein